MPVDFLEHEAGAMAPAVPLRKAAMLLHSMTEVDRRWMLARLEPVQRSRLGDLLDELRALDFPVDAALVRASLEPAAPGDVAPRGKGLAGWSAEHAAEVLLPEPDDLVALVLCAGEWPWAPELRTRLGSQRLRAVEASRYGVGAHISTVMKDTALKAAMSRSAALLDAASTRRTS